MAKTLPADEVELTKVKFASKTIVGSVLTIAFGNGETVSVDSEQIPSEIHQAILMHGLSQMVGDSYAGSKGDYGVAIKAATKKIGDLLDGKLSATREGSGTGTPRVGELAAALARVQGCEPALALEALGKMSEEQKKSVRANSRVKAAILAIRAENAAKAAAKAEAEGKDEALPAIG